MSPITRPSRSLSARFAIGAATAGMAVALSAIGATGAGATARPGSSTPVLVDTTTTTAPDTSTSTSTSTSSSTSTSTTTSTSTSTTTTHPTTTSTTVAPTTTTTTVPAADTSKKTPWGLIALIVVLVIAIAVVILLYVSRNKKSALDAWRRRAMPALTDARLAREALLSPSAVADDAELRASVAVQVERASAALEQAGSTAPDPAAGGSATTAAGALRGLAFAIEADRLLRNGAGAPTGVQLAEVDQARRDRDSELQGALARLQAHVTPPTEKS